MFKWFFFFFQQCVNKDSKVHYSGDHVDMLPEWEKEKLKAQNRLNNENSNNDDSRKTPNAVPVPVVKDASEFRELTQVLNYLIFIGL